MESTRRTATPEIPESVSAELFRKARAARYGLTEPAFAALLRKVSAKYLTADPGPSEIREFLASLRLEDLALACACVQGHEAAWEDFLTRYREKLYHAAYSIAREESAARELADSLYGDLYGVRAEDGRRVSKLDSYTGRGSLEGWLRAVLAQEYVNRYRRQQHTTSLEEQTEAGTQFASREPDPTEAPDARLAEVTDQALAALTAEDKFILAGYYLDGRTLADIARALGVHESTVSRKLEKITSSTRKAIRDGLIKRGMSRQEAEQSMAVEVTEITLDVRRRLMQEKGSQSVL